MGAAAAGGEPVGRDAPVGAVAVRLGERVADALAVAVGHAGVDAVRKAAENAVRHRRADVVAVSKARFGKRRNGGIHLLQAAAALVHQRLGHGLGQKQGGVSLAAQGIHQFFNALHKTVPVLIPQGRHHRHGGNIASLAGGKGRLHFAGDLLPAQAGQAAAGEIALQPFFQQEPGGGRLVRAAGARIKINA